MHKYLHYVCSPLLLALALGGCSSVSSSSISTVPGAQQLVSAEQVVVSATYVPEAAEQVAIVETNGHSNEGAPALIAGFRAEVARVGGTFGKIDTMRTRFEMVQTTRTESYSCGTTQAPRTCTRTVTQDVEVGTTTVLGRAFRTGVAP